MNGLAQHMLPVGAHECCDLYPIDHGIEAGASVRFCADGIDASVRATAVGEVLNAIVDIFLLEIQRDCTGGSGQGEVFRNGVDGDDPLGAKQERAFDRELSNGAAAPDGDGQLDGMISFNA